ncbi:hypothetical protein JCM8097_005703 [Rhodosporidiobolus ruineniae]
MSSPSSRFEELPDEPAPTPARTRPAREGAEPTPPPPYALPTPSAVPREASDEEQDSNDEDEDQFEDSVWWTTEELKDILSRAQFLKSKGNAEFGQGRWEMALETYREGLGELPVRTRPHALLAEKGKEKSDGEESKREEGAEGEEGENEHEKEMEEVSELRAMLSANVAACLLKLERHKEAVKACDDALEEKPDYLKALHRRAMANEAIGSWSSLSSSLEDFNKLSTLPSLAPSFSLQIRQAKQRLPRKIEEQQQKEKDEVLGKLKDLGNMVLGKFGLSTDNFKFQEQPGGGYNMQFQQ